MRAVVESRRSAQSPNRTSASSSSSASTSNTQQRARRRRTKCAFYKEADCPDCPETIQDCDGSDYCYVLWKLDASNSDPRVKLKGCWTGASNCDENTDSCVDRSREQKQGIHFCCCSGDLCNEQMHYLPQAHSATNSTGITPGTAIAADIEPLHLVFIILLPIVLLFLLAYALCRLYRWRKMNGIRNGEDGIGAGICESKQPFIGFRPIQLIEAKAVGRFGAVWKGSLGQKQDTGGAKVDLLVQDAKQQLVAVKIFPASDKSSWQSEREIYSLLSSSRHEHILAYIGAEMKESLQPFNSEYWLITEYHERGSLYDHLKAHVLSYRDLLKVVAGMARGLNYLHEEMPVNRKISQLKPSIAHRDFKSKNVLLKADLTPCIADFGLALVFYPNRPPTDTLGQVGTRRYMAPEVLEGAINFSRDALLRIDMYAASLVMWECVSRCSMVSSDGEYMVPFEDIVGAHPSLEDMQEAVCQQKRRPVIKDGWRNGGVGLICDTMEDCWDADAEARLSASCVEERVTGLEKELVGGSLIQYFAGSIFSSPKMASESSA